MSIVFHSVLDPKSFHSDYISAVKAANTTVPTADVDALSTPSPLITHHHGQRSVKGQRSRSLGSPSNPYVEFRVE
jgi:hypothetical protein